MLVAHYAKFCKCQVKHCSALHTSRSCFQNLMHEGSWCGSVTVTELTPIPVHHYTEMCPSLFSTQCALSACFVKFLSVGVREVRTATGLFACEVPGTSPFKFPIQDRVLMIQHIFVLLESALPNDITATVKSPEAPGSCEPVAWGALAGGNRGAAGRSSGV